MKNLKEIEKKFEKKLLDEIVTEVGNIEQVIIYHSIKKPLRSFFSQTLTTEIKKAKEEILEKIRLRSKHTEYFSQNDKLTKESLLNDRVIGYNQAISDLEELKEKIKGDIIS